MLILLPGQLALPSTHQDIEHLFRSFAEAEVQAWARLGVSREPTFLLLPSGTLDAHVACHLHCPSFSVADPLRQETADESNDCTKQVLDLGFTPTNCLIFDHLPRREALDGFEFYPKQLVNIHEGFLRILRREMSAIVEICWGSHVRKRMLQLYDLVPLDLWGRYDGIRVYLEWEKGLNELSEGATGSVSRFVIFVNHPQRMLYGRQMNLAKT